ncbi:Uncharacterized protein APZ42_020856 [Daphnia magna]|uniref:Uncharacterized protein n=1 Tax=Daphnia magna TaxID=35525 RepID=A0A164XFV3_9CRUS|nr:Uncharacterized protein APZ42_020856 [Daphnia magna]
MFITKSLCVHAKATRMEQQQLQKQQPPNECVRGIVVHFVCVVVLNKKKMFTIVKEHSVSRL